MRLLSVKLGARVRGACVYSIAASMTKNGNILRTAFLRELTTVDFNRALSHVEVRTEIVCDKAVLFSQNRRWLFGFGAGCL